MKLHLLSILLFAAPLLLQFLSVDVTPNLPPEPPQQTRTLDQKELPRNRPPQADEPAAPAAPAKTSSAQTPDREIARISTRVALTFM